MAKWKKRGWRREVELAGAGILAPLSLSGLRVAFSAVVSNGGEEGGGAIYIFERRSARHMVAALSFRT